MTQKSAVKANRQIRWIFSPFDNFFASNASQHKEKVRMLKKNILFDITSIYKYSDLPVHQSKLKIYVHIYINILKDSEPCTCIELTLLW